MVTEKAIVALLVRLDFNAAVVTIDFESRRIFKQYDLLSVSKLFLSRFLWVLYFILVVLRKRIPESFQ